MTKSGIFNLTEPSLSLLRTLDLDSMLYFYHKYSTSKLTLKKKVSFVKTKGGEFALKVSVIARARSYVENIKITDRLPGMVKLYERYGSIAPDRVDNKNRRVEWDIESLGQGDERMFSYIIYSKIGI